MSDEQHVDDSLIGQLPLHFRLALSYAPVTSRRHWLAALAFDARLGAALRQTSEPVMAQLRLAWWRDRLGEAAGGSPAREPLLARIREWPDAGKRLIPLVDGWEALLAETPISGDALEAFAAGRVALVGGLCEALDCNGSDYAQLARDWALADLMVHLSDSVERDRVRVLLVGAGGDRPRTARAMRPLAVLAALSRLAARKGHARVLQSPKSLIYAIRVGIFG